MLHLEQRPAAPPDAHYLEPTRIGAEQRVELLVRAGTEAAHQDVRYALALEVGTVLRRRGADAGAAAVRVHVEGDAGASRVQPDESLVIRRQHGVGSQFSVRSPGGRGRSRSEGQKTPTPAACTVSK